MRNTRRWQRNLIEAPQLVPHDDGFVLVRPDGYTVMLLHAWPAGRDRLAISRAQLWLEPVTWNGVTPTVSPLA